jgi:lipid-binding SYLF domain-containing protein
MSQKFRFLISALTIAASAAFALMPGSSIAHTAAEIDNDVDKALASLYAQIPEAKKLGETSKAILVFPKIIKGGLILVGGQGGEGALRVDGKTDGYYSTIAVSYGLQLGVQWFGYAMFFRTDDAHDYLDDSDGWEVGTAPSVVLVDEGAAGGFSTSSLKDDIYVFFFNQEGLMAGLGLQGTKITKITPDK